MAIPDEDVARVRAATDLTALVSEHSTLKRVGRRFSGLCPFHQEKSPSFSVNPEEGLYYCFGCGASGDAISFVRAMDGVSFVEAVERLAARAGVAIRHDGADSTAARADQQRRQAMHDATAAAIAFYHDRLLRHPDGGPARQYLRSRGYDGEIVRRFVLGWAPAGGDVLVRALEVPDRALRETGLAHGGPSGRLQDAFRGRVIFPIFDTSNRPIALGGRILPGLDANAGPKYRNSPETPIYSKRRTLYGLNWAKTELQHVPEVVVCEGYTDVIGFHVAGVRRAVATCGTALTEEHLKVLGSFAKKVVLAFDADAAGQSAAGRIYESEKRHGLEVAVAALPAGSDPADLARSDPEALGRAVEQAVPYLSFRIERAMSAEDLRTAEGRARAAEAALPAIAEHPSDLVRDQYVVMVADRCRIDPDLLRARLSKLPPATPGGGQPAGQRTDARDTTGRRAAEPPTGRAGGHGEDGDPGPREPAPEGRAGAGPEHRAAPTPAGAPRTQGRRRPEGWEPESRALLLAVHRPDEMAPYLHESLFAGDGTRRALQALAGAPSLHAAIDAAEDDTADLLRRLAVGDPEDSVDGAVVALARAAAERALRDLMREARAAGESGDSARVLEVDRQLTWVKAELDRLLAEDDAARADDARPLLAWLSDRSKEES